MFANMAADDLAVLSAAVGQDVLDEIISELVTSNCVALVRNCDVLAMFSTYCR
jgi:hypothetical protein